MTYSGTASISYSVTSSSITCKLINLGDYEYGAGSNAKVLWLLYDSSNVEIGWNYDTYNVGDISSAGVAFTGLIAGATYKLKTIIYTSTSSFYASLDDEYITLNSSSGGGTQITRPSLFSWTSPKVSGATFNLKATEWNSLTANINAVRLYRGLTLYNFTVAYTGNDILASMYNECLYAMNPMYSNINLTDLAVSKGDDIKADLLNILVTLVNNL